MYSINKWKKELETGEKLLRDIIDLDASVEQDESIEIEESGNINIENNSKIRLVNEENNNDKLKKVSNDSEDEKKAKDEENLVDGEENLVDGEEELDDEIEDDQDNSSMSLAMLENLVRDQVMRELGEFSSNSKKILKKQTKYIDHLLKGEKIPSSQPNASHEHLFFRLIGPHRNPVTRHNTGLQRGPIRRKSRSSWFMRK